MERVSQYGSVTTIVVRGLLASAGGECLCRNVLYSAFKRSTAQAVGVARVWHRSDRTLHVALMGSFACLQLVFLRHLLA